VDWKTITFSDKKQLFKFCQSSPLKYWTTPPKINSIVVDNYQGLIQITCDYINRLEWYLDDVKIKTKYNVIGKFANKLNVDDLKGKKITFVLFGDGGQTKSKIFELLPQEVLLWECVNQVVVNFLKVGKLET